MIKQTYKIYEIPIYSVKNSQKFKDIQARLLFNLSETSTTCRMVENVCNICRYPCFSCTVKKQKLKSIQAYSWNPLPMLSFSKCLVCLFSVFTPFLSVLIVFRWKNIVLLHLMNRYTLSTSE